MHPKPVFRLSFSQYGDFWGKNIKTVFGTPTSPKKDYINFFRPTPLSHDGAPPPKKKKNCGYFGKIFFFFLKKLLNKKYSKPHFLQKRLYWFLSPDAPFHSKRLYPPRMVFCRFFRKINIAFFENLFNSLMNTQKN